MNPNPCYLSNQYRLPNAYDRAIGHTGSQLMVHGDCSSRGCYAMTDEQIGEIYALAANRFSADSAGSRFQAYPFRMTREHGQAPQHPK